MSRTDYRPLWQRLEEARAKEWVTVAELALLVGISERTVWRRLARLTIIRDGRITRIHRVAALRYFLKRATPSVPPSATA